MLSLADDWRNSTMKQIACSDVRSRQSVMSRSCRPARKYWNLEHTVPVSKPASIIGMFGGNKHVGT